MTKIRTFMDRFLAGVCAILFAALVLLVVWQVFSREILSAPSTWSADATSYMFVWLALFGAALMFSERGHIAVTFLANKLPGAAERVMASAVQLIIMMFALAVFIIGGAIASTQAWGQQLSSLPGNVGVLYLAMPVTGVLVIFYAAVHLIQVWQHSEEPAPDEFELSVSEQA